MSDSAASDRAARRGAGVWLVRRLGPVHRENVLIGDRHHRGGHWLAVSMLLFTLAACGGDGGDGAVTGDDGGRTTDATSAPEPDDVATSVDACELLSAAEVEPYLGVSVEGSPGGGLTQSSCVWTNADTEESVTLSIYEAGTAASGELAEPSDYGDTEDVSQVGGPARFAPGENIVEFIAGDRDCEIQVAVLDEARAREGAVALARLVHHRI